MHLLRRENYLALPGIIAVIFIILSIVGGFRSYSPVPYWDMWGTVDFFIKISDGDYSAWWAQHNEHRIVCTRILSWIDFTLFNGSGLFLVVVNYVLVVTTFMLFYVCLQEILDGEKRSIGKYAIGIALLTLLFSWIQQENLVWSFQSSFFLAQLLPLLAFYFTHKAHDSEKHSNLFFATACLTGMLSPGTLANGVITLPLMTLLALILQMGRKRILSLAILSVLATYFYFYNYTTPAEESAFVNPLLQAPFHLLLYVLTYLGGPLYYISEAFFREGNLYAAQAAGLFMIGSSVFFAHRSIRSSQSSLQWALLTFMLYIVGTALATGIGRLTFGIEQALSSRYMTPALMAWSTLLVLYSPAICKSISNHPVRALSLLVIMQLLFLPYQLKALHYRSNELFERRVAALALELGVRDSEQISSIFPFTKPIQKLAKVAADKNISIFGNPLIKDAALLMGKRHPDQSSVPCIGNLEQVYVQLEDERSIRIQGWMTHTDRKTIPEKIHLLDQSRHIVGYALTGQSVKQIQSEDKPEVPLSGFKGYLSSGLIGEPLTLKGVNPDCELKAVILPPSIPNQAAFGIPGEMINQFKHSPLPVSITD